MQTTISGDGAFASATTDFISVGLTKREYFAVMALQGLLSADRAYHSRQVAEDAVDMADELIQALNK